MKLSVYSYTNQGGRAHNEDSLRWNCDGARGVFVLADGLGGHACGQVASRLAVDALCPEALDPLPCKEELLERFQAANTRILEQQAQPGQEDMRTTAVALSLGESGAAWAHIGDSRLYRFSCGALSCLTRDHSVVEDMVARGDITPEQARTHPRKNLITRALGAEERIRADLYEKELVSGDFLLLCSDGLSNILSDQELLYEVLHGGEPADCCQRLLNITISRGAPDNVTAVLFQIL